MRVHELASALELPFQGDRDLDLQGVASLETATERDLSFCGNRKVESQAQASRAGALIVTPAYEKPDSQTVLRAKDPRAAFARAVRLFHPQPPVVPGIHPTAVVDSSAEIHDSVEVGPGAVIGAKVKIGEKTRIGAGSVLAEGVTVGKDCNIFPQVSVYEGTILGDRVLLHSGCVIGADGFGFAFTGGRYEKFPQIGRVLIGSDVEIGANSCVDRAALGATIIEDGAKLDNLVHIGHNCHIGKHVVIAAQTGFAGGVVIEDYAVIGGQVGIGEKARVETGAVLGSGAGVLSAKIVRKGEVMWGTPARPLRQYLEQLANLARLARLKADVQELKQRLLASGKEG